MRADLVAGVEQILQREVVAFMSDNHIDPDLAIEAFVLAGQTATALHRKRRRSAADRRARALASVRRPVGRGYVAVSRREIAARSSTPSCAASVRLIPLRQCCSPSPSQPSPRRRWGGSATGQDRADSLRGRIDGQKDRERSLSGRCGACVRSSA